jgi:hypothetical protein
VINTIKAIMSDDNEDPKEKLKKFKPKKKKLEVPAEFLDNAKSYEDKLMLVQHLTEREKGRVLLVIRSMLSEAVKSKGKVK